MIIYIFLQNTGSYYIGIDNAEVVGVCTERSSKSQSLSLQDVLGMLTAIMSLPLPEAKKNVTVQEVCAMFTVYSFVIRKSKEYLIIQTNKSIKCTV